MLDDGVIDCYRGTSEMMKIKDGKSMSLGYRGIPVAIMFLVLCGFSFYLGGIFCSGKDKYIIQDITKSVETWNGSSYFEPLQIKAVNFPQCGPEFHDHTPCTDPKRWRKFSPHRLAYMERHCPPVAEKMECLVPPPDGYKITIRWPKSKDECWYKNVPSEWINKQKSNQHWLKKEGEKFVFPGGGTMFPNGVSRYVDLLQDLLPGMKDGTIRTAIDTGCGVASFGGELLDRGILTVSLAPRDNHQAQVQFALERGIPAILGIISTQRLPFPSNSFDMAHCSRCLIPWADFGGIYLLEIHRILRPGGFWVLSGPPVNYENRWKGWNTTIEDQKSNLEKLQELLTSMCFKLYSKKDDFAIWQKLSSKICYKNLNSPENYPPLCDDSIEPDSAWYTPMRACLIPPNQNYKKVALESLPKWPDRLHSVPERIAYTYGSLNNFKHDEEKWNVRIKHYKKVLPAIGTNEIRNVMDMNTLFGGFSAALINDPVWVMNVVTSTLHNTLSVVYDRGLIGAYHDWCEAFSTYPRTYDLLHLDGLFTGESQRCEMKHVLLEMDRILRPNGYAIIRESSYFVDAVARIGKAMRWECRKEETEYSVNAEKLLVCQKVWYSSYNLVRKLQR